MQERLQRLAKTARGMADRLAPARFLSTDSYGGRQLLIIPQDLRTADPSLASEIASGHFGVGGATAGIDDTSPWMITPPTHGWARALHSFEWLRDLRAAGTPFSLDLGRQLTLEWIKLSFPEKSVAWSPPVVARRLISWLTNAPILIDEATEAEYDGVIRSVEHQLRHLIAVEHQAPPGLPRLVTSAAILFASLCLSGEEDELEARVAGFAQELDRQIRKDGCHVSRNPIALVELLLDLLPLKRCFVARDREPPERLVDAIQRMLPMLRRMRLGDGMIARFNGVGATMPDALGTVLAFDETMSEADEGISVSRYARMTRRRAVIIADVGPPPPTALAGDAFAGCLSFEMSSGAHPLIVNCGAPGIAHREWRLHARGTPAHSTLVLSNASSSVLGRQRAIDDWGGGPPIEGPTQVGAEVRSDESGAIELVARHNGYVSRFGAVHHRSLRLGPQGDRLEGIDQITGTRPGSRLGRSMPFAIHFHVPPTARLVRSEEAGGVEIGLSNGERWRLRASGAELGIEESIHLASLAGPVRSAQAVLRGMTSAEGAEVRWRLERVKGPGGSS